MRMQTEAANSMRDLNDFINKNHIPQERIVNIMETSDGMWIVNYFVEE